MTGTRRTAGTLAVTTAAVLALGGCGQEAPPPGEDVTVADVAAAETEAGDGESDWEERPVTVQGQVVRIVEAGAFLIGDPGALEPTVLVLSPTADFSDLGLDVTDALVEERTVVEVDGTVRRLSLGEFQEDYGLPYEEEVYEQYAGEAVIVAESLVATTEE